MDCGHSAASAQCVGQAGHVTSVPRELNHVPLQSSMQDALPGSPTRWCCAHMAALPGKCRSLSFRPASLFLTFVQQVEIL